MATEKDRSNLHLRCEGGWLPTGSIGGWEAQAVDPSSHPPTRLTSWASQLHLFSASALTLDRMAFLNVAFLIDQVVRADMVELYDMDIKGRPLAYTPFCDNIKDMDGCRLWRQGFWKDHLQGKPYHISALYVVDLVRFRQTGAGDNLRVSYETLSKDPNSLSNLDQPLDLPGIIEGA